MEMRKSNFELMRIVSMFMIILWHIFLYAFDYASININVRYFFDLFKAIMVVHVNSFIILTGYFQCKSTFKMPKLLKLIDEVWFYKIIIFLIFIAIGLSTANPINVVRTFFPFDLDSYWFIRVYLLLYIISPYLNIIINNLNRRQYRISLVVMFLMFSILSAITKQEIFTVVTVNNGFSIVSFVFLYFIGAYFRNYPIEDMYIGKKYSKKLLQLCFIIGFFLLALFNFSLHVVSSQLLSAGQLCNYFANIIFYSFDKYDNPLVVLGTICYFRIFYFMDIKSTFVNKISSAAFGIYLIHENTLMRDTLYKIFRFPKYVFSSRIFIHILSVAIIIFVVCCVIDLIRQKLFKIVYNFKISKWWRQKYQNYLKSLGLNIKW